MLNCINKKLEIKNLINTMENIELWIAGGLAIKHPHEKSMWRLLELISQSQLIL